MEIPKITKITVNMGVGEAVADRKVMDAAVADLTKITGQKPVLCMSKKSIASFKVRENLAIGTKVTLRGERMWEFFDRLRSEERRVGKAWRARGSARPRTVSDGATGPKVAR